MGVLLLVPYLTSAQSGATSSTADNSTVLIEEGTVELRFAETCYFGPNAHWIVNGTLEIWSHNIWIAPTAVFSGTGKIIIHDPGANPYYEDMASGPTLIDGNNNADIGVILELRNPNNLILADIADPGYETANPEGPKAATLYVAKVLDFAVDGADIILNGNDLFVGPEGILHNYSRNRMIVTGSSVDGHVSKAFGSTLPFTFPIGIAEGDYTPATLSPAKATTLHVGVQRYKASEPQVARPEAGMNRIWHIYADEAVYTAYSLQHNSVTNGSAYVDERAQIAHYAGGGNWLGGNTERIAHGAHARDWIAAVAPSAGDSWLTKLVSDHSGPQANDDEMSGPSGRRLTVVVLANDLPGSTPIDVTSVRVVVQPMNGSTFVNADGSITYTSSVKFVGDDAFVYEVTDQSGLKDIATVRMSITYAELLIPNALTPNGDGKNDLFFIQGLENYDHADLTVFNRWGNEVYRNRNYAQNWDGGGMADGTYYFNLILKKSGVETVHKGWILIKRQ